MKKLLVGLLISAIVMCGCGKSEVQTVVEEKVDTDAQIDDLDDEIDEEPVVNMGNPWVDCDKEEILSTLGFDMAAPEGAKNISYQMNEGEGLAQMLFTYGEVENEYTYRMKSAAEFEDISGLYYEWVVEDEIKVGWCEGVCKRAITDSEMVDSCLWYDAAPGIMYSLSTSAEDLDGFDIMATVEQLYVPTQEDYEGFIPSNFLEEKLEKDSFSSFDEIISELDKDNAYAIVKVFGLDEDVLIITNATYDNGGIMASIDGSVYRNDNGSVTCIGNVFSSGTAYPISIDKDGMIYSGGNHEVNVSCISQETNAIMNMIYAYETFDEDQNVTYGGFVRSTNNVYEDGEEIDENDSSVLQELYKKYGETTPINYTVIQ